MNLQSTNTLYNRSYEKALSISRKALAKGDIEKTFAGLSIASSLSYHWNQKYVLSELETLLVDIISTDSKITYSLAQTHEDCVLFYDSFGLDTRGLALIYLEALGQSGKQVIYVTSLEGRGRQKEIDKICQQFGIIQEYIDMSHSYKKHYEELISMFSKYRPQNAFLYTTAWDSSGIAAFTKMKGTCNRFKVNLTDHAFWLGINSFDHLLEFREYGARVSHYLRGIPIETLLYLPYYPKINDNFEFEGLPFDYANVPYIFSGGAPYKIMDEYGTYGKLITGILAGNQRINFVYAGAIEGQCKILDELVREFPNRVFLIPERKDLYEIMKRATLYINTYPIAGALMMQYASVAGKIPITVVHDQNVEDILLEQKKREIEYSSVQQAIIDVLKLLEDAEYLQKREQLLQNSIITSDKFNDDVAKILNGKRDVVNNLTPINTDDFRSLYRTNFSEKSIKLSVANKKNTSLIFLYPKEFLNAAISKLFKR